MTTIRRILLVSAITAILSTSESRGEDPAAPIIASVNRASVEESLVAAAKDSLSTRARNWLRHRIVEECDLACYHLAIDQPWQKTAADKPVVVVVHGYNSSPARNQAMRLAVSDAGYPCGTFAYPNDYTIPSSAQLLSSELRRFARENPGRRVILVCHSMGGLVARACIEDPLYDPGNVERLIMIAPPNSGTLIAHFAVGTDLWEHWLARRDGGPMRRLHASVVDGLGEAADDLIPGSPFLAELNSRPRNPDVAYSVILGTGAQMSEAEIEWVRNSVVRRLGRLPGAEPSAIRLQQLLCDVDELVEGKGDGVVSVERGRLTGVNDTLVLPFGHLSVTGDPSTTVVRQVQHAVLERLN